MGLEKPSVSLTIGNQSQEKHMYITAATCTGQMNKEWLDKYPRQPCWKGQGRHQMEKYRFTSKPPMLGPCMTRWGLVLVNSFSFYSPHLPSLYPPPSCNPKRQKPRKHGLTHAHLGKSPDLVRKDRNNIRRHPPSSNGGKGERNRRKTVGFESA